MLSINKDKFEDESRQLLELYANLKLRRGSSNKLNSELIEDIIYILSGWERILILSEVYSMNEDTKKKMLSQMRTLKTLEKIYEEQHA